MTRPAAITGDHGAGTPMVAMVAAFVVLLSIVGVVAGAYLTATHRARGAADLAALAAAHAYAAGGDACRQAGAVAAANATELSACQVEGSPASFVVAVTVRSPVRLAVPGLPEAATASARAGTASR